MKQRNGVVSSSVLSRRLPAERAHGHCSNIFLLQCMVLKTGPTSTHDVLDFET